MKVYGIQSEVVLGGTAHIITTGMWKSRPSEKEVKELIRLTFSSFYSPEKDELIGKHYVVEYEVSSNIQTHLKKSRYIENTRS